MVGKIGPLGRELIDLVCFRKQAGENGAATFKDADKGVYLRVEPFEQLGRALMRNAAILLCGRQAHQI